MDVRARGLLLSAGPRFSVDGGHERHLRVPFTSPPEELARGVRLLGESWHRVKAAAPADVTEPLGAVV